MEKRFREHGKLVIAARPPETSRAEDVGPGNGINTWLVRLLSDILLGSSRPYQEVIDLIVDRKGSHSSHKIGSARYLPYRARRISPQYSCLSDILSCHRNSSSSPRGRGCPPAGPGVDGAVNVFKKLSLSLGAHRKKTRPPSFKITCIIHAHLLGMRTSCTLLEVLVLTNHLVATLSSSASLSVLHHETSSLSPPKPRPRGSSSILVLTLVRAGSRLNGHSIWSFLHTHYVPESRFFQARYGGFDSLVSSPPRVLTHSSC